MPLPAALGIHHRGAADAVVAGSGASNGTALRVAAARTAACVRSVRSLVTAIGELAPLAGMNALQADDPFAIAWQDLNATAAHYSVSPLQLATQTAATV